MTLSTPSHTASDHLMYDANLVFPNHQLGEVGAPRLHNVPVVAANLAVQGIDGLIGRDLLEACVLICNGTANTYTLCL